MRYAIDPSKIAKDLGWYPETDFETGINSEIKRIFLREILRRFSFLLKFYKYDRIYKEKNNERGLL